MAQDLNIAQSIDNTVQSNYRSSQWGAPISLLMMMGKASEIISPWWSTRRDVELRNFVKASDHVSSAMYNFTAKMTSIPIRIEARDKSIKTHVELARQYEELLNRASQFGDGWVTFFGKFVEDLCSQDNGAFAEIIGPGDVAGPLTGMPYSIANLDAARCIRTGDPVFPVMYQALDGKLHKLHFTRVIFNSQMPSNRAEMFGVGFCAVSRILNASQNLIDIAVYKQEKLGSRPPRQMMLTGGGLDPEDLQTAFSMAERSMSAMGLDKYSRTIVAGSRNILDPKLQVVDMASVPDGFNEKESTVLAMAVVAMGFGMDARELFPAMESGATKADALVQHMKQRGKGPGQTIQMMETQLDTKFLPPYLKATFDYQDDAQDRQRAEIESIRSQSRQRNLITGVTNQRTERERMVEDGEITTEQFEALELMDGRLVDGVPVDVLFFSQDKDYKMLLSGVSQTNFQQKMDDIKLIINTTKDVNLVKKARRALAAIHYKFEIPFEEEQEMKREQDQMALEQQMRVNSKLNGKPNAQAKPDTSYEQDKFGRTLGRDEVLIDGEDQGDANG